VKNLTGESTMADRSVWNTRLDKVKKEFGLENDLELALFVGLTKSALYQFRRGETDLGPITKLIVLDRLGFAWAKTALGEILPAEAEVRLIRANEQQAQRNIERVKSSALHSDDGGSTEAATTAVKKKSNALRDRPKKPGSADPTRAKPTGQVRRKPA
jgi:hypothetical protein